MKNVVISFKHEYRRLNLTLLCDVTNDVTSVEHTFSGIICNDLLGYDVKMNLEYFEIFKMAAILMFRRTFKLALVLEVEYNINRMYKDYVYRKMLVQEYLKK